MDRILYVDDETDNLLPLKISLSKWYKVDTAINGKEALQMFKEHAYKVVITDQRMPEITGLELAKILRTQSPKTIIIILTAFDDSSTVMEAINQGNIFRYLLKPWELSDLHQTLIAAFNTYNLKSKNELLMSDLVNKNNQLEIAFQEISNLKSKLEQENTELKYELNNNLSNRIIGNSKAITQTIKMVHMAAKSDATVLLMGESGTGKEVFVNEIHSKSNRSEENIIKINCAAIPENLVESELFGHEKGSFTGANERKFGKFELANKGTIFLDEIGELPLLIQSKLLRVLQEGELQRVGGTENLKVNVRIIAATNKNLEAELKKGTFRADLFYRLNVIPVSIAPLRERKEDIPLLTNHFVNKYNKKYGKTISSISPSSLEHLLKYQWPGNVRELENIIERYLVLSEGEKLVIDKSQLRLQTGQTSIPNNIVSLEEHEKTYLTKVLKYTNWKIRGAGGAAELLELHPSTLDSKLKKLGISKS
ncbi:sigma-54-dependent transcriptional regulator [Labilibacter marinus]|uniref:sigma-54-dependent transcriptional regulator n=1 Tax=Labilibacter marinus TaxID=1477105 RepID=UPI00094FA7C9|nr:sigma-54 dependent transcriptional regulator [Labilibacter marinus]